MATRYSFGTKVDGGFEQTLDRVTQALAKEGFGILSDIDVAATLKKKLGVEIPAYRILGACNPQFANQALEVEPEIGTLLPCNVVVRSRGGQTQVDIMDPMMMKDLVGKPAIEAIAREVRSRLDRVLASL